MQALAIALLRLYPRTWRMRYEEEVRLFLEEHPPGLADVAGLFRNGLAEWIQSYSDPVAHPGMAGVLTAAFGWLGLVFVIQVTGASAGGYLRDLVGAGPAWAGWAASAVVAALILRGFISALTWRHEDGPFRFIGRIELRCWWAAVLVSVIVGQWADRSYVQLWQFWMCAPSLLMSLSESAWRLAKARAAWMEARQEHLDKVRGYMHVSKLVEMGLATPGELEDLRRDVAKLNEKLERAAGAYRAAGLRRLPPHHPLGLSQ